MFEALLERAPMPAVGVGVFTAERVVSRGVARAEADAWWDLASLTKVLVTLPEALRLPLDAPLGSVWARASGKPVGAVTVRQLLSHTAGLPPTIPFFRTAASREEVVSMALESPVALTGRADYSDIGYLLAGELVRETRGLGLDALALSRSGLRFAPLPGPAVPTEQCPWRGRLVCGEVHDENAYAMGGVAGHAGAFGTLDLVTAAAQSWLGPAPPPFVSANPDGERFALGWWLHPARGIGGSTASVSGYGQAGFVGNRIWFEPDHGYGVVILSNRIHPTRAADRAPFTDWCDTLLTAVANQLR
ncbi:serine hydrolase domain-containing protein [Allorhizocola rhizosphaerae]|uniref:serine hydrolase domain-containing protein n=1 Tax=Allorhizocola rhizosphaerae TaxID=1872709 RepID=UPI0013C306FB|nr:serine hydrolase domain-containing protein [Allorhizocola rhizosphaerae]